MTKNNVSYQDLYKAIDEFRKENNQQFKDVHDMFERFHQEEFEPLKDSVNSIKVYWAGIILATSFVGSFAMEWIKQKLFN